MKSVIHLMAVIWCALAALPPAQAENRLALSVGIDVYDHLPGSEQLKKAVNDARAMAATFRDLGFTAEVEENVPKLAFTRAWQRFLDRLEPGDTAAVFFAGHGVVVDGGNYLLPRDVPKVGPREDKVLAEWSIRLNDLMLELQKKGVRVALFIVDACRENPFRDARGRFVGGTRGLAVVEPPKGSFVLYSAGYGERALDRLSAADTEPNSPYTRALLPILKTPGLSMPEIAVRVRRQVIELARQAQPPHEQTPAYYDQLVGEFLLKAGPKPAAPSGDAELWREAERAWAAVKDSSNIAELEVIAKRYERSVYADLARARIEELRKKQIALAVPPPSPVVVPTPVPAPKLEPAAGLFSPSRAAVPLTPAEERSLKPKDNFKECDVCPEMVVVPSGSFMMGSSAAEIAALKEGEFDLFSAEGPRRRVTIRRPFAVGRFEVTFAEWDACLAEGGCSLRPDDNGWGRGKRPVAGVRRSDITQQYLPWLSRKTGKTYRLLTEAEWEYAARAGTTTRYHFGNRESDLCTYGNVLDLTYLTENDDMNGRLSCRDGYGRKTAPVGSFMPNAFGLYDMHGNVWEWVQDCWNASYNGAPSDGSARTTAKCNGHVFRGGSWLDPPDWLRSAKRYWGKDETRGVGKTDNIGFRVGRTL